MRNSELKKEIVEAMGNKDIPKLNQLKHQIKVNSFINRYVGPNGINGSIPIEAWVTFLPQHLAQ